MSIFSHVESGTSLYRSLMPSKNRKGFTGTFFTLYPNFHRFCLPGDIWNVENKNLVRYQAMLAPMLTNNTLRQRFFFVPLRLVEENCELVITGSKDGKLYEEELPSFGTVFDEIKSYWLIGAGNNFRVFKDSILNIFFGIKFSTTSTYSKDVLKTLRSSPAMYWLKAYCRVWWDYYRDENHPVRIQLLGGTGADAYFDQADNFEDFFQQVAENVNACPCLPVLLPKDYFTSSLPWLLKGVQPTISFQVTTKQWNDVALATASGNTAGFNTGSETSGSAGLGILTGGSSPTESQIENMNANIQHFLDNISITGDGALSTQQLRDMVSMTRVFERLARAGSRYTEYLRANFGTSPADETLQRAKYLGGFKQEILVTEVLQTAEGSSPVGTMRGHGVSYGGTGISNVQIKEFGVLIGMVDVRPNIQYSQGINREFTYKSRFDFFNPSFQHLSEQEVRKGEIFFDSSLDSGHGNAPFSDETFGFQGMYNELRTGSDMFVGDFGDGGSMSFWTQALHFSSRPELNGAFLNGRNHLTSFLRPFGASDVTMNPIIFDCLFVNKPYRPMVKYPTPGLIDHL